MYGACLPLSERDNFRNYDVIRNRNDRDISVWLWRKILLPLGSIKNSYSLTGYTNTQEEREHEWDLNIDSIKANTKGGKTISRAVKSNWVGREFIWSCEYRIQEVQEKNAQRNLSNIPVAFRER